MQRSCNPSRGVIGSRSGEAGKTVQNRAGGVKPLRR